MRRLYILLHILLNKCGVFCHIHITQCVVYVCVIYAWILCRINNVSYNNSLICWVQCYKAFYRVIFLVKSFIIGFNIKNLFKQVVYRIPLIFVYTLIALVPNKVCNLISLTTLSRSKFRLD
nr:MAG TPA: hypothetical protein [Caudoviricetes sp.]